MSAEHGGATPAQAVVFAKVVEEVVDDDSGEGLCEDLYEGCHEGLCERPSNKQPTKSTIYKDILIYMKKLPYKYIVANTKSGYEQI